MREDIRLLLEKNNIESRPSWKPMHLQQVFKTYPKYLNGKSDELYKKGFNLIAIDQRSGGTLFDKENETFIEAKKLGKSTSYLDAEQDIEAAINFTYNK